MCLTVIKKLLQSDGVILFGLSLLFNILESIYFGWGTPQGFNMKPQSIGEFICDYIAIFGMFSGVYLAVKEIYKPESLLIRVLPKQDAIKSERGMKMIELGQKAKDKITGLEGVLVGRCQYLYGCTQYGIAPPAKDNKVGDTYWFDEGRIQVLGSGISAQEVRTEIPGGPNRDCPR